MNCSRRGFFGKVFGVAAAALAAPAVVKAVAWDPAVVTGSRTVAHLSRQAGKTAMFAYRYGHQDPHRLYAQLRTAPDLTGLHERSASFFRKVIPMDMTELEARLCSTR